MKPAPSGCLFLIDLLRLANAANSAAKQNSPKFRSA
jgi:hypothetical protein